MSNSTNYSIDRDTLIRMGFETFGAATEGEPIQPEMIKVAARWLNLQLKNYTTLGFKMWKRERESITLTEGKNSYTIGQKARGTTTATVSNKLEDSGAGFVGNVSVGDTIFNKATSISTTITVIDSNTILSVADDIFTLGDDYEITDADISLARPDRILECNRKNSDNIEVTMIPLSLQEYNNLPNKSQLGTPIQYFYDPLITNGKLYLWLMPDATAAAEYTIEIVAATQTHDMDNSTDLFDFPQEWLLPIAINLGYQLEQIYGGMSVSSIQVKGAKAQSMLDDVADYDQDTTSVFIQPDFRSHA